MLIALIAAAAIAGAPPPVRGDFDHDGKVDVAEIVAAGSGYNLVIRTATKPHRTFALAGIARGDLGNFFLAKADRGSWRTWCGKGGDSGPGPCRRAVTIRSDALTFGYRESTESVAIWTGKRFEIVLLSD